MKNWLWVLITIVIIASIVLLANSVLAITIPGNLDGDNFFNLTNWNVINGTTLYGDGSQLTGISGLSGNTSQEMIDAINNSAGTFNIIANASSTYNSTYDAIYLGNDSLWLEAQNKYNISYEWFTNSTIFRRDNSSYEWFNNETIFLTYNSSYEWFLNTTIFLTYNFTYDNFIITNISNNTNNMLQ